MINSVIWYPEVRKPGKAEEISSGNPRCSKLSGKSGWSTAAHSVAYVPQPQAGAISNIPQESVICYGYVQDNVSYR